MIFHQIALNSPISVIFLRQDNKIYIDICPFFIIFHFSVSSVPSFDYAQDGVCGCTNNAVSRRPCHRLFTIYY